MISRIVAVSSVVTVVADGQSNGLASPGNESDLVDVYALGRAGDTPDTPTVAEVFTGGKRYQPSEQIQFQDVNSGVRFDHMWAVAAPVPPAVGATCDRGTILHKLVPVLDGESAPTGGYTIDPAVYAFALAAFTQPAVNASASALEVTNAAGFSVDDVVYLGIGCLYDVTAVNTGPDSVTLKNRGLAAAVLSTSA